jgi:hypothetical protein
MKEIIEKLVTVYVEEMKKENIDIESIRLKITEILTFTYLIPVGTKSDDINITWGNWNIGL